MKKNYIFFIFLFANLFIELNAQATITYDLQCSGDNNTYELYITRTVSPGIPFTNAGSSRVTLVLPAGTRTVSHVNEGILSYSVLPAINNPNGIGSDFYGFSTTGGESLVGSLPANIPALWLTFTPSDGTSQDARLFLNGSDPDENSPGMSGVDLSNTFTVLTQTGIVDEYNGNLSNIVNCTPLDVENFAFNALDIYPNPAINRIYVKGDLGNLKRIKIFTVNGQLVKYVNTNFIEIDISGLNQAMYFVELYSINGAKKIIKLVIDSN